MKFKKIVLLILVLVLILIFSINVFAVNIDKELDITLVEMENKDKEYYLNKLSLEVIDENSETLKNNFNRYEEVSDIYKRNFIYCFDVSEDGKCVVFFDNDTVVIFGEDGNVEKVLKFKATLRSTSNAKSSVQILWNENNLWLLDGEDYLCIFTTEGKIIDVYNYESQKSLNFPFFKKVTVKDNTYKMEYSNFLAHFFGGNKYDILTKTNILGEKNILFDSQKTFPNSAIPPILFIIIFNAILLFVLYKIIKGIKK